MRTSHVVESGETFSKIADEIDVNIDELYAANQRVVGEDINMIHPGQTIVASPEGALDRGIPEDPTNGLDDKFAQKAGRDQNTANMSDLSYPLPLSRCWCL